MRAKELFLGVGIANSADLAMKTGLSKQRAHQIWNGCGGIGRKCAEMIYRATGIEKSVLRAVDCNSWPNSHKRKRRCS